MINTNIQKFIVVIEPFIAIYNNFFGAFTLMGKLMRNRSLYCQANFHENT